MRHHHLPRSLAWAAIVALCSFPGNSPARAPAPARKAAPATPAAPSPAELFRLGSWNADGELGGDRLGGTVAGGDVNGDGFADVLIGAPGYTGEQSGEGRVYLYLGSKSGLAAAPAWTADPTDRLYASFGASVAVLGDVNGDGFADVLIGAPGYTGEQSGEGRAYLYLGTATGLEIEPSWSADPTNQPAAGFGVVGAAGDINGDGLADAIIGAPRYSGAVTGQGIAYVYLSTGAALEATASWSATPSAGANGGFGTAVAGAGDVNRDGFADIVIGAPDAPGDLPGEGGAFLYLGTARGPAAAPAWRGDPTNQAGARFGYAVAGAGDVNGDGFSDILVGAPGFDTGSTDDGRSYLFLGTATGVEATPRWNVSPGSQSACRFGLVVAGAGDINGDGFADVLVGAPGFQDGNGSEGRLYLFSGSKSGLPTQPSATSDPTDQGGAELAAAVAGAGDINGDGFADVIIGAPGWSGGRGTAQGRAFIYGGESRGIVPVLHRELIPDNVPNAVVGEVVASVGDINADGYTDVLIGAPGWNEEGRAYLYLGSTDGIAAEPAWTADPTDEIGARFGEVLIGAGDVNGDGFGDVLISAPNASGNIANEGLVYLYLGTAAGLEAEPALLLDASNQQSSDFGRALASGDINGDGYLDMVITAEDFTAEASREGRAYLYLGGPDGFAAEPTSTLDPTDQGGAGFGQSVAFTGDLDGDGYGDMVIAAPDHDEGSTSDVGRLYVYRGTAGGLSTEYQLVIAPEIRSQNFGIAMAAAGDVNGDGRPDLVVGAEQYADGNGRVFLYLGTAEGLGPMPVWADTPAGAHHFGVSVSSGDFDGDGLSDIVVGSPDTSDENSTEGHVFVYRGRSSGILELGLELDLYDHTAADFGRSVAAAGDINGDGFADLVVGMPDWNGEAIDQGLVAVLLGGDGQPGVDRRMRQLDADGVTLLVVGGKPRDNTVVLTARVTHEGPGAAGGMLALEVEIEPMGRAFDGIGIATSEPVIAGELASVTVSGLDLGGYHWRARVRYPGGLGAGRWVAFGGNLETEPDFSVIKLESPVVDSGPITTGPDAGATSSGGEPGTLYSCNCQTGGSQLPSLLLLVAAVLLYCRRR